MVAVDFVTQCLDDGVIGSLPVLTPRVTCQQVITAIQEHTQYFLKYNNSLRPKGQEDIHAQYLSLYVLISIQRTDYLVMCQCMHVLLLCTTTHAPSL